MEEEKSVRGSMGGGLNWCLNCQVVVPSTVLPPAQPDTVGHNPSNSRQFPLKLQEIHLPPSRSTTSEHDAAS